MRFGARGEILRGKRARVAGGRRDEGAAGAAEALEQLVDPFLAQDRDAEDVVAGRDPRQQPVDGFRGVRPVADLAVAVLEPAGQRDLGVVLDLPAEERFGRFACAADDDLRRRPARARSNVLSDMTTTLAA